MGAPAVRKKRRKAPFPNSILDRAALIQALEDRNLSVSPLQVSSFYRSLHRQHYPSLREFCNNYEKHEQGLRSTATDAPLAQSVSNKKNRNKLQLPQRFLDFLQDQNNGFVTMTSKIAHRQTSQDGTTTKLAIHLWDGQLVESVLMRYINQSGSRASLCVSSQCGCAMGCTFCATGTMGWSGNLTSGEILEQIVHADQILATEWAQRINETASEETNKNPPKLDLVRNVVFMGMGEPLDNYTHVVEACKVLLDPGRWNLRHGHVTVSTVGLVSQIRKLTKELPQVNLALSLHAPNQEDRQAICPTAKQYPIKDLIDALDGHMMAYLGNTKKKQGTTFTQAERFKESSKRRAMIEYVMLEGPTSTLQSAHQLGKLTENRLLVVNLIPYNQTNADDKLRCPPREHIEEFRTIVASYGSICTIRRTMGADIDSACGQLITLKEEAEAANHNKDVVKDIEDSSGVVATHTKERAATTVSKRNESSNRDIETTEENSVDDLERWIQPLAMATAVAGACFLAASALYFRQARRR